MMEENKGSIEIEIYLRNKYPSYSTYIPKIISDLLKNVKLKIIQNINLKKTVKKDNECNRITKN